MKILVDVINVDDLDDYIDNNIIPLAVCTPKSGVTSKRQNNFLTKYYDKVVDKKGWVSYYCNVTNANKCRDMDYKEVRFADGNEEKIIGFELEECQYVDNKYIPVPNFASGKKLDVFSLVKMIRLKVEDIKKEVND